MFEEINNFKIKVYNPNKKSICYIPNVISIGPLDNLLTATEWLVDEAVKDYNDTYKRIDERRAKSGYSKENLGEIKTLGIRLGSRTQSYVNQLCLIEDILKYEYKRMAKLVNKASDNQICFDPEKDYEYLKERFLPIRTFRHKVVAHTAYTFPKINQKTRKIEDNPETIISSILNLFPNAGGITLGNNFFNGFSIIKSQLPVITIFDWQVQIKPIFVDWKKLFIKRLKKIHTQCPFKNKLIHIDIANPHLARQAQD